MFKVLMGCEHESVIVGQLEMAILIKMLSYFDFKA